MLTHFFYVLLFSMNYGGHTTHGSLMTMTYENHKWQAELAVDVEHFEEALESRFSKDFNLEKDFSAAEVPFHIQLYISEQIQYSYGKKSIKSIPLESIYLQNGTAHFVFKPIKKRFKTRYVHMTNSFMLEHIKDQKNLVNISYNNQSYSMLFTKEKQTDSVELKN